MAWITDSLRGAIEAVGRLSPFGRTVGTSTALPGIFTHQLAVAAYMASGMMKKVISIPAEDRVREWRDWQAEADQITTIEAEENRLGLIAKVQEAETLRGIGGGALVIVTAGSHDQELRLDQIAQGGIVAVNVVSRWQITGKDWIRDLASPRYGEPQMWEMQGGEGVSQRIHPSRVICFRGARLPAGAAVADEEAFWGDSRLLRVFTEVQRSDETQAWFAALVRKAKLLRIGIPDLDNRDPEQLNKRIEVIALGESSLNATVYRSSGGQDDAGETITDYQVTWAGIPAMMDAFDQRVAAVSDIPFTRLTGRSPAGMNATGEHDTDNWNKMVVTGQKLETRPCLEQLDPCLLRSAGVDPAKVTWKFAPLSVPSEKEEADTFNTTMDAVTKLHATGAIPDEAFAKGVQNLMSEREYIPGLDQALAEIPEAERFGLSPTPAANDDTDPSRLQAEETPQRSAANDKKPEHGGAPTGGRPFEDARIYRRDKRGRFALSNGSASSIMRFLHHSLRNLDEHASLEIGVAGGKSPAAVHGYARRLHAGTVQHALKEHGDRRREASRGQLPIRRSDIVKVPKVVEEAHNIRVHGAKGSRRGQTISYTAKIGQHEYTYVETVGTKRQQLVFKTMWKK